jgi:hypothetical protein
MAAAGLAGLIGAFNGIRRVAVSAGVGGTIFALINLATLNASQIDASVSVGGQSLVATLHPHVSPAGGSWAVLVASLRARPKSPS